MAIGLVIVMFGLEQFLQTQDEYFLDHGTYVNLGVGFVSLVAAARWLIHNVEKVVIDGVHVASVALVGLAYFSQNWTLAPREFDNHFLSATPYFVLFLGVAPILSMDKLGMRTGVWSALLMGMPLVFLFVFFVEWEGRGVRLAAPVIQNGRLTWDSPSLALSSLAAYVGMLCVVLVPKSMLLRALQLVTFLMACYVAYRTQSRGQLIALGATCLFCYPLANQATKIKGLLFTLLGFSVLAVGLFVVFSYFDLGQINRWNEEKIRSDIEGRMIMAEFLLDRWANAGPFQLLFGLGACSGFATSGFYIHNLPLEILGELGIAGALLFIYINVRVLMKSWSMIRKLERYDGFRREVVALIALFLFSSIISLKQGALFSWPHLLFFAIAISQMERHSRQFVATKRWWEHLFVLAAQQSPSRQAAPRMRPLSRF